MAASAVGLKTHIWNNNLKSLLFLLLYPIILSASYVLLVALILLQLVSDSHSHLKMTDFPKLFYTFTLDYWYVPYGLLAAFLVGLFCYNSNRLDIGAGLHAITRKTHPAIYTFLENLCISRGMTMPYFFIQHHPSSNAYTSGLTPHTYRIVITSGLVVNLKPEEIEAVLAHELTHIINGDTRLIFLTGSVTNIFRTLAEWVLPTPYFVQGMGIRPSIEDRHPKEDGYAFRLCLGNILKLANIGALFAQLFISRKREYIADAGAVELTKNPQALIAALRKVGDNTFGLDNATVAPTLFNYYKDRGISTHPPIRDRIAAIAFFNRIESEQRTPWKSKTIRQARQAEENVVW